MSEPSVQLRSLLSSRVKSLYWMLADWKKRKKLFHYTWKPVKGSNLLLFFKGISRQSGVSEPPLPVKHHLGWWQGEGLAVFCWVGLWFWKSKRRWLCCPRGAQINKNSPGHSCIGDIQYTTRKREKILYWVKTRAHAGQDPYQWPKQMPGVECKSGANVTPWIWFIPRVAELPGVQGPDIREV